MMWREFSFFNFFSGVFWNFRWMNWCLRFTGNFHLKIKCPKKKVMSSFQIYPEQGQLFKIQHAEPWINFKDVPLNLHKFSLPKFLTLVWATKLRSKKREEQSYLWEKNLGYILEKQRLAKMVRIKGFLKVFLTFRNGGFFAKTFRPLILTSFYYFPIIFHNEVDLLKSKKVERSESVSKASKGDFWIFKFR